MARLAGRCGDLASLSGLGQVLAWRCGAAHFRTGASDKVVQYTSELPVES
ncbi:MAG: hypothetical protein LBU45_08180 [Azoarcus sp.]|nr:hypothetical protein [Azoarcus sp.]